MKKRDATTAGMLAAAALAAACTPGDDLGGAGVHRGPISFGMNDSTWADDGVCDDPRFEGPGTRPGATTDDRGADAGDCAALYDAGRVWLAGVDPRTGEIDFGNDASRYAHDGECDDPRFTGPGTPWNWLLQVENRGHDATDCRRLHEVDRVRLFGITMRPQEGSPDADR